MSKTITEIFNNYIQKNYPNVNLVPIKKQISGTTPPEDIFKDIILKQAKISGYYK